MFFLVIVLSTKATDLSILLQVDCTSLVMSLQIILDSFFLLKPEEEDEKFHSPFGSTNSATLGESSGDSNANSIKGQSANVIPKACGIANEPSSKEWIS